mmetsp:Transcript_9983/g.16777  ORF Transcript_9983/g.16777 Transcript_9983/m.16777 type:complete len:207 (+) Transcript_9983:176-796(+)
MFPVSSGGSKDEKVSCTVYDPTTEYIIVAGNSTSEDYAPAANNHAFAYAVDLDGNWKWGKFFYNVSYAVSTISGCQIDDNGKMIVLGIGDSMPIIMGINPLDGSVTSFLSIDKVGALETNVPWYTTFAAIHHDVSDREDGLSYYYVSFIMQDYLMVLKINSVSQLIKWNFQYYTAVASAADAWKNKKIPGLLHQDPNDDGRMYLIG